MKKKNKKTKKELPIWLRLILILIFSGLFIYFGICLGFLINSVLHESSIDIFSHFIVTLITFIIYMIVLLILVRDSDDNKDKPFKWYLNCILISLTTNLIVSAVTVFAIGCEEDLDINLIVGFGMFPLIGIITSPNIIKYAEKDTEKWKGILYKNGDLYKLKDNEDFYKVKTPVPYEKKLLSKVISDQIKNILVVIVIMIIVVLVTCNYMINEPTYGDNIFHNLRVLAARRAFGFMFFLTIFFVAFCIPIIVYYLSNALKKIRVIKNHEYLAYHAIIPQVNNGRIGIYHNGRHYSYKYCSCVGIREKDVKFTPMTMIFIPDDVLLFPDEIEDNKEIK